ncbi:pyridoxamine 5'-phosphate oxidase family protein [Clostridium sp. Marseille-P2415]|uniref:pyridoxamine 5'-phosphate oxidase family protein n=1 Tax=Clostridium sp. Marseille-P2415 TaxID=1805471 RepID=UPI0009886A5F|nr:pyridoxamine 5'-phosphate oxidase family protein [Clostridium sp. Marseille-P2415]
MFREMRRKKQLLSKELSEDILNQGITGVLGVIGDEGYPYTVPLNYVYEDGVIYFHCAKSGHKLDAIRKNNKVSFCVIEKEQIVPEKFTTYFRSVIAFGKAGEVEEDNEKWRVMRLLNDKYAPGRDEAGDEEIQREWNILCVIKIQVEHLTGKEAIELVKKRN